MWFSFFWSIVSRMASMGNPKPSSFSMTLLLFFDPSAGSASSTFDSCSFIPLYQLQLSTSRISALPAGSLTRRDLVS